MKHTSLVQPALTLVMSCTLLACLPYTKVKPDEPALQKRFDLLHARKLSAFEQRLAIDRQIDEQTAWTRVGYAWLALANCQKIPTKPFEGIEEVPPLARVVHASLMFEDSRRRRLIYHKGTGFRRLSISGTMFARLDDKNFFERGPGKIPEGYIKWPAMEESWADELPARIAITDRCQKMYQGTFRSARKERAAYESAEAKYASKRRKNPADVIKLPPPRTRLHLIPGTKPKKLKKNTLAWWEAREFRLGEDLLERLDALPQPLQNAPSINALRWRVKFHLGYLAGEIALDIKNMGRLSRQEARLLNAWIERLGTWHRPLAEQELAGKASPAPKHMRSAVLLELASFLESEKMDSRAIKSIRLAEEIGMEVSNTLPARYQLLRLLSKTGRWAEAVKMAETLPPVRSRYFSAYVHRVAYAMRQVRDIDSFMAITLKAFRDRPYRADPFMRALYIQMLHVLNEYPFEVRTTELLEDMGDRSYIYERLEEYATVALDKGKTANATAAANWLLAKHSNANYRPRYHAILALSAFLENDPKRFLKHIQDVIKRPQKVVAALPQYRRATFFAGADAQLARIFRQMLPVMAEWGDTPRAKKIRQGWLRLMMQEAQTFVRRTPGSMSRPELLELYRLASAMLDEDQPRAYPEKVGNDEPAPLVLGTVKVSERDLEPYEPISPIQTPLVWSMVLLPRDSVRPEQWTSFWGYDIKGNKIKKKASSQAKKPKKDATKRESKKP